MYGTLSMLLWLVGYGAYHYWDTKDVVSTLNVLAWSFTLYMAGKVLYLLFRVPRRVHYATPRMEVPEIVNREHVPTFRDGAIALPERAVADLLKALCRKIRHAADEAAIHSFVNAKLTTMRRTTHERFSSITGQINVIGFEGIIGTLIGLVVFMAQATVLFKIPEIDPKNLDSGKLISGMAQNFNQINLWVVSTAFFTSIIGWSVKAWIGAWVDQRMGEEAASITLVESWLQDEILARLTLPAEITALLKFADVKELHGPLTEAVADLRTATTTMNDVLARSAASIEQSTLLAGRLQADLIPAAVEALRRVTEFASADSWRLDVAYVSGGVRVTPRLQKAKGNGHLPEEPLPVEAPNA